MRSGFSLVELSTVLVILGLLTGGILAGQNLIRAAELRSVVKEYQNYQAAVMTFRDKYFAIPGDISNATDFWGAATCPTAAGTGTATCNGNGDGKINDAAAGAQFGEKFTFWQHLANAGLLEGSYTGMAGPDGIQDGDVGVNIARSRISNAGWYVSIINTGDAYNYNIDFGTHLVFGKQASGNNAAANKALTPEELWNVDTKIDDGKPGRGKLIATYWPTCTLSINNSDYDKPYDLQETGVECIFRVRSGF